MSPLWTRVGALAPSSRPMQALGPAGVVPCCRSGRGRSARSPLRAFRPQGRDAPRTCTPAAHRNPLHSLRPDQRWAVHAATACFASQAAIICRIAGWVMLVARLRRPCGQCASALHCSRRPSGMQRRRRGFIRCSGLARAAAAASPESPARSSRFGRVWFSLVGTALHRRPRGWCSRGLLRRRASRKDFEGKRAASTGRPAGYARRMRARAFGRREPLR